MKAFVRLMPFAASLLAVAGSVGAAEPEGMLDKAGVENLVLEHKLTFTRHSDNQRVRWDIRKNGMLYGENLTLGSKDTARWTIDDRGVFCVKWRGNSVDGCREFAVREQKTTMFDPAAPGVVAATIETVD